MKNQIQVVYDKNTMKFNFTDGRYGVACNGPGGHMVLYSWPEKNPIKRIYYKLFHDWKMHDFLQRVMKKMDEMGWEK